MSSQQDSQEVTPADLHNCHALGHEACSYHFTHDGTDSRWLLDSKISLSIPPTEKLLNVVHQVMLRARKVQVPAKDKDDIYRPEVMRTIETEIDRLNPQLREINIKIHGTPFSLPETVRLVAYC